MEKIKILGEKLEDIEKIAYKYSIKNCYEHNGKAELGAVIGKVKAIYPNILIGQTIPIVKKIIEKVNKMEKKDIENDYYLFEKAGWELKIIEKEKTLPKIEYFEKKPIVTRSAPCPTGAMHFGHARPYILLDEYVKKYGGTYFMRFDDTDPKIKIPEKGIEKEFLNDFKWLGINIHGIKRQSDNLKKYLKIIEILLAEEKAYICFCKTEDWRKLIWKGKECNCRNKKAIEQLKHWKEMLKGKYKEGKCVVRLKTNLEDSDSSTRDWWLAKIVDNPKTHPNKKTHSNHVWPSYNLASAVDDHEMGINFTIRGQEHIQNEKKQKYLYNYFNWNYPITKYHGKINKVGDMVLSKSKIKILMEKEGLIRDDDPRLATIKSFRRRGFKPEAIRKVILDLGLNTNDVKIDMENFGSANKTFLGEVKKYSFIEKKAFLEIKGMPNKNFFEKKEITQKIIIDKKEINNFKKDEIIRIKEGYNIIIKKINKTNVKALFLSHEKTGYRTINWLEESKKIKILMNDGKIIKGFSDPKIRKNEVVYFNGIGFVKIEEALEELKGIFTHK